MSLELPLWLGPKSGDDLGPPVGAQQYRQLVDLLFAEGVIDVAAGQLLVTPSSGMTLAVAVGAYVVDGDDVSGQGAFLGRNLAPGDVATVPAAPASNSRIDRVVVRVYDAESIGGSVNLARIDVVQGTASATPVAPVIPNSAIPLARVTVAAGTSTITSAMLTDDRPQAGAAALKIATAALAVTAAATPAAATPGALYYVTDTNSFLLDNGGVLCPVPVGFGNGSDGDVTVTGTTTLARDMNYRTLTVASGGVLVTKGFTVRAARSVTVASGGVIHDDGGAGGAATATAVGVGGSSGGGGVGEYGQGGYSSNSWPNGGGGGGGGGVVAIVTPTLVNNGTVRANGGAAAGYTASTTNSPTNPTPAATGRFSTVRVIDGADYFGGVGGVAYNGSATSGWGYLSSGATLAQQLAAVLPASLRLVGGGGGQGSGGSASRIGTGGGGGLILTATARRSGTGTYSVAAGANSGGSQPVVTSATAGQVVNLTVS